MTARRVEAVFLAIMALAVLIGGPALMVHIATFKGLAVSVLGVFAIFIIYAFRQNYRATRPGARLAATRDTAFLATIAAAISFTLFPARWSLGTAVVGLEVGIIIEFLSRLAPPQTGIDLE
jgi:hypothetical protein